MLTNSKLGRYEVLEKIGAGGMGEVYRARDEQLDRNVALKVLLPEFSSDAERVRRFKLEAKAASALNHPNIITIFEIVEIEDRLFIVYEYVEGKTLREKIARNQLSIFNAVKLTEQVANALAVAHSAGIIHRDIKPENIMLREDGYVKILDFGLAKKRIYKADSEDKTLKLIKTQEGLVMGSVQYMSPEQARGQETDERTDIWSLGVVLYEMLTGKNPFAKETVSDSIAALIHNDPEPITNFVKNIPKSLQSIVEKALQKDLPKRYQSTKDFALDLREIKLDESSFLEETLEMPLTKKVENGETGENQTLIQQTNLIDTITNEQKNNDVLTNKFSVAKHKRLFFSLAAVVFGIITIFTIGVSREWLFWVEGFVIKNHQIPFQSFQVSQLTSDGTVLLAAISPDGKLIAYVKKSDTEKESLIVSQISTESAIEIIEPSLFHIHSITFSHDGESIYYFVDNLDKDKMITKRNTLFRVPTLGGRSKELLSDSHIDSSLTFSPDGKKMAFVKYSNVGTSVYTVDSEGLDQQEVVKNTDIGVDRINEVGWSPDDENLLVGVSNGENEISKIIRREDKPIGKTQIAIFNLKDKSFKILNEQAWYLSHYFRWLGNGFGIAFLGRQDEKDISQIWYISYPDGKLKQISADSNGFTSLDMSNDGKNLIAVKKELISSLLSFDLISKGFKLLKNESKTTFDNESMSNASKGKILFSKKVGQNLKIFSMDEDGKNEKQITFDDGDDHEPVSTPDGRYVFFSSNRKGSFCIWRINSDGTNPLQLTKFDEELGSDGNIQIMSDGKSILFERLNPKKHKDSGIMSVPIEGGEVKLLMPESDSWNNGNPKISPNGKYLAYYNSEYIKETGKSKYSIRIVEFDNGHIGKLILQKKLSFFNQSFQWTPDGKNLTYVKEFTPNLWLFPIDSGEEVQLTDFPSGGISNYVWSANNKNILIIRGTVNFDLVLMKDESR